jgi:hypothetical protein
VRHEIHVSLINSEGNRSEVLIRKVEEEEEEEEGGGGGGGGGGAQYVAEFPY